MSKTKQKTLTAERHLQRAIARARQAAAALHKSPDARFPWRDVPKVQLDFAELASDMIQRGGHESDVKALLEALLRHERRRMFPRGDSEKAEEYEAEVRNDIASSVVDSRYGALLRSWPEKVASSEALSPKATTVTEMVHRNLRKSLKSKMHEFMRFADLADCWMLAEILIDWESRARDLGEAFSYWIDGSEVFVRVEYRHVDRVREFIERID